MCFSFLKQRKVNNYIVALMMQTIRSVHCIFVVVLKFDRFVCVCVLVGFHLVKHTFDASMICSILSIVVHAESVKDRETELKSKSIKLKKANNMTIQHQQF